MGTYILMTSMTPEISADLKRRAAIGKEWKKKVDKLCPDVKWLAHYALLGPYDFMDIYEAEGDETAAKVSLISRANGALKAESWPAIEWKHFIRFTKEIGI
ncbi:MAG: GYD domain-containing protein [Candidatus Aminicenantes bacterium]|nr:GYD domain-containing protein [Candidatus Aminicenantes bacterium]